MDDHCSILLSCIYVQVSQTITRGGPRSQIAIPAQGMIEFRDALTDLLEEFGTDDGGFKGELPEGRHMRVENKNFYFDIGQNNRGIYMRISEVIWINDLQLVNSCILFAYFEYAFFLFKLLLFNSLTFAFSESALNFVSTGV